MLDEKIPHKVEGIDITKLTIAPKEGFVYSRVDGVLNVQDIADLSGSTSAETQEVLDRLEHLGAIRWLTEEDQRATRKHSIAELGDEGGIDPETRSRIMQKFRTLDHGTHYELLGVAEDAESPQIRTAYFKLSKQFHPDSHFGKDLGSFKSKMEAIFKRLTDAYETLSKESKRAKYDEYLGHRTAASKVERQLARGAARADAMARAMTQAPPAGRPTVVPDAYRGAPTAPPSANARATVAPAAPQTPARETKPAPAPRTQSKADRIRRKRELLERRLGGRRPTPSKPPPKPVAPKPGTKQDARAALRNLTASLKATAAFTGGIDRVQRHMESARVSELEGDLAGAATALRMAVALDPEHPDLKIEFERVTQELQVQLVDIHRKQADYEEENELWGPAAISWAKVAEGLPNDSAAPCRAAAALLKAGGDLRRARAFAQKSVELAPESAVGRTVLAQVYIAAEMKNSARKELEEAAKLDPTNEIVKNLLKRL